MNLNDLEKEIESLSAVKANFLRETCIWCLNKCQHNSGVSLSTKIEKSIRDSKVTWSTAEDIAKINDSYNIDDALEFGAEAISLLLIKENTEFQFFERAVKPSGIDYWLRREKGDSLFSMGDARLEISGILKETSTNNFKTRLPKKERQTQKGPRVFPLFISLVEFSNPKAEVVKFNEY